ncbi:MAG: CPBP family intramembrane metalloprotease [Candidatus Nomurabacteria bacterium]|nr:CPBP family intramembrane metalloprotease [Candidatus Nomurabacteria bacterium]
MDLIKKERELVWLQILYLFLIPILLLYLKVITSNFRIILLLAITLLLYGITRYENWNNKDFGIQQDWKKYFWQYVIFTILGVVFLVALEELEIAKPFLNWWKNAKFLLLFIPLSVAQELIFRGVLMNMFRRVFSNPLFIIVLNASLFSLMHIIYLHSYFVLPVTFIGGIGLAWMYYKYENLVLISISHTILNFVGMILGFFVIR